LEQENNMEENSLLKLGLKEKEASIYLALLKSGPILANQLAKKTGQVRTTVYSQLDLLIEKGFVSYTIQSGKRFYRAADPQKLLEEFQAKKEEEENTLKEVVQSLKKTQGIEQSKTKVEVFEGKEGLKTAFLKFTREQNQELLHYGSSGISYKIIPLFMEKWNKERIKKKIFMKIIYNHTKITDDRIKNGPKLLNAEYRFSPIKDFSMTGTMIYKNTVTFSIWDPENCMAIVIENPSIAKSYRENFEILWKNSIKPEKITQA
jgi:sugar-specific transcriptional regulator TrmB